MKKLFTIFVIVSILFSFCSVTASAIAGTPTEIAPVTETTPQIVQDNPLIAPTIIDTDISDSEIILPGTTETYEEYVPFVSISANEYAQSYEGLTDLSYAFTIYSHQEYDYIAVSYATTMNIALDDYERGMIINCLNENRNKLIADGKYTDAVDEVLLKILNAKQKKFKVVYKEV